MRYIIGLNAYHGDASACLLRDGQLIAACEEERFRRIKHWAGFPSEAIAWCLKEGGITLAPSTIGLGGISKVYEETDLGGLFLVFKLGFSQR